MVLDCHNFSPVVMGAQSLDDESLDASCTSNGSNKVKTVYLIRHAESDENRRRDSLNRCFSQLTTGEIPSTKDLNASFELLNVPAQLNSDVSSTGAKQIKHMGDLLKQQNFLEKMGVQLVVHSPLQRARQTCDGLLGCQANPLKKPACVQRVVETEFLIERQPQEVPQDVILKDVAPTQSSFTRRIKLFEQWLEKQPEDVIAVVGHSLHFKSMLNVNYKFKNCEVWVAQFEPKKRADSPPPTEPESPPPQSNKPPRAGGRLTPPWAGFSPPDLMTSRRQKIIPWTGLKRVYSCDLDSDQEEEQDLDSEQEQQENSP